MKTLLRSLFILFLSLAGAVPVPAAEQAVFGPVQYDVKERYGKANQYTAAVPAAEGLYVIRVQNGLQPAERPHSVELSLNGRQLIRPDRYPFPYIACFVTLAKENTLEVVLKDEKPAGFRRPPATPRNITVTVLPVPPSLRSLRGSFGIASWEKLADIGAVFQKIKNPAAAQLAMESVGLQKDDSSRAEAIQKLSDLKEKSAEDFLLQIFHDPVAPSAVRAEICLALAALGDRKVIPLLTRTVLDPDDRISIAAARGLSFYPEEDTADELAKALGQLDPMRKNAAIRTIASAGWKPVKALIDLSLSDDPYVATMAVGFLGEMRDPRATDRLITMLQDPAKKDVRPIIRALGTTGDARAGDVLLAIAADQERRKGKEADLGEALANLGDQRAKASIVDLIKHAPSPGAEGRLRNAYFKLTGKEY